MATRQYIGARYTPKFSGTYNNTQAYEALEVVDNGSGTTYIARKPVPPNTPLTNTEYWLVYGSSSGAILDLQSRVGTIENEIPPIQSSILSIGGQVATNTSDIGSINGEISDINDEITDIKSRKIVMITDSYGNRINGSSKNIGQILTDRGYNIEYYVSISGGSFASSQADLKFISKLDDYTGDKSKITDVIFAGSANDFSHDESDIFVAIQSTVAEAKRLYPNAKVHVIPWGVVFANVNYAATQYTYIVPVFKKACLISGAYMAENAQYILRNSTLLEEDLTHPNSDGVNILAGQVDSYLKGLGITVDYLYTSTLTVNNTDLTNVVTKNMIMRRHNGNVSIMSPSAGFSWFEFRCPTGSGIKNLGSCFDMADTLCSYPDVLGQYWLTVDGYAYNDSTDKLEGGHALIKIGAREVKMLICGDIYLQSYSRYLSRQDVVSWSD